MLVVVLVLGESECFTIELTEQNNFRINGGLCRQRTPMHRGRARRRGRARLSEFGLVQEFKKNHQFRAEFPLHHS
jgi:hypothetical protein